MRWIALSALRTNRADCNKVLSLDEVRSYFSEECVIHKPNSLSPTFWLINDCCGKRNRSCGQVTVVVKITASIVESFAHLKAFLAGLGYS